MTSIRIVGLQKKFGDLAALSDVNLDIREGEFFTLLGPSGCGKTTLLRTIAGFYRQDHGDIYLGNELVNNVPAYKRNTGMVFQNYAVFPHMTVYENVAYGLKVRKFSKKEIDDKVKAALKNVHLTGYEDRTPDKLSGGQQQRVGLARAMAIEPRVLLFDEPLSNLDAKLRVEMREEIRDVQKKLGITAIYVTHDQEEALVISDRIAVVNLGRIQQVGAPWEIYKNPVNLFVATLVGKINTMEIELKENLGKGLRRAVAGQLSFTVPSHGTEGKSEAILAFRPEDIQEVSQRKAGQEKGENENQLSGLVDSVSFLGSTASITARIQGTSIILDRHCPKEDEIPLTGSSIHIFVPNDACLLFDKQTGVRLGYGGKQ
ncbi:MAG: ABC transporter ATP-binding protein [Spirochaetaceae bacterium]|nr:ABC transporter ATP-binding protein [Spirochaetaceae bacterium]